MFAERLQREMICCLPLGGEEKASHSERGRIILAVPDCLKFKGSNNSCKKGYAPGVKLSISPANIYFFKNIIIRINTKKQYAVF